MNILTWNIQATKGCDGVFDASRIIKQIKQFGHLDVICLQEVSRYIPDLNSDDQFSIIAMHFSDYEAVWAPGFSALNKSDTRCEFGNLTLVRRPIFKSARVHCLPSPSVKELQMPRSMVEVTVSEGDVHVAIFNAHLAFHSSTERVEQIRALTHLRDQILAKANQEDATGVWGPYGYTDKSQAVILCGDLNVGSDTDEFKSHIVDQGWVDCWTTQQNLTDEKRIARQPTCGCFDQVQWSEGPHVRDYFLATDNIAGQAVRVEVDVETDASDHQPVLLEILL